MTKELLAVALDGRSIGNEITLDECQIAKNDSLVVIFGASDDLCEFRGAIYEEIGAWNGADFAIKGGRLVPAIDRDDEEVLVKHGVRAIVAQERAGAAHFKMLWCKTLEYSWTFETSAPHATFDVIEDEVKYCRGIVIDLKELP